MYILLSFLKSVLAGKADHIHNLSIINTDKNLKKRRYLYVSYSFLYTRAVKMADHAAGRA